MSGRGLLHTPLYCGFDSVPIHSANEPQGPGASADFYAPEWQAHQVGSKSAVLTFNIGYCPGSQNRNADGLSRQKWRAHGRGHPHSTELGGGGGGGDVSPFPDMLPETDSRQVFEDGHKDLQT